MRNDNNWQMINPTHKTRVDSIAKQMVNLHKNGPLKIKADSSLAEKLQTDEVYLIGVLYERVPNASGEVRAAKLCFVAADPRSTRRLPVTIDLADNPVI